MRVLVIISSLLLATSSHAQDLFDQIKQRGYIFCSVNNEAYGFAYPDRQGSSQGFAVDLCKGIGIAVFNDASKSRILHTISRDQIPNITSGNADVNIRTLEWTLHRESFLGISFAAPFFYDTQKMAVKKGVTVTSPKDLDGATVCINQGNNTEVGITDWFRKHKITYQPITYGDPQSTLEAFKTGRCDVFTQDSFLLTAELSKIKGQIDYEILPYDVNVRTYGIAVRKGEYAWENIVKWVLTILIYAEELGITKANVRELATTSQDPNIRRVLGTEGNYHQNLGLPKDWAINLISYTGNYGELFNKHFGKNTAINWPERNLNRLCKEGGRLCPVPIY
jgi:general L-amino acid transport system substrate-binding protein